MKSDPTVEPKERLVSATVAFVRTHVWLILAVSALVVAPCLWHPRIEAGDLGSHVYNAWLVQLIQRGQAPGLYLATRWNNVLFDLAIGWTSKWTGLPEAEKLVVPIFVLIFFWGCFALISAASRKPAWYLTPAIAILAYGWTFHAGFINCYVSLGLAFFGAAIFWRGNRRERLWTLACAPLIVLAHPMGLIWLMGTAAYITLSEWIPGWKRILLLPAAALTLAGMRIYIAQQVRVTYIADPFYWFNGADQLWLFGHRCAVLATVAFFAGAACFLYDAIRKRKAGTLWTAYRIPLELYAISILAVVVLPNGIRATHSFGMIIQRFTTTVGALGLCVFARVDLKKWHLAGLIAVAAVFFVFLYQDTGLLNQSEQQVRMLVRQVPNGARVTYTMMTPTGSRIPFFVHLVDRPCIGRCFVYENYEAASEEFRVRVQARNHIVVEDPTPRCEMERGHYVVQASDLPVYQIYQPVEDRRILRIQELKAGEENGSMGLRQKASNFCTAMWGPYPRT